MRYAFNERELFVNRFIWLRIARKRRRVVEKAVWTTAIGKHW